MGHGDSGEITFVLPTYNRAAALRANLGNMLALEGVSEIVVVDDGSTDDTAAVCAGFADDRLKLIRHERNMGVAKARNTGLEAASTTWVVFGEDDCRFPPDYAVVLRDEAERHGADIVGAPLLHVSGSDREISEFAASAPRSSKAPTMDQTNVFPAEAIVTPFLPARALMRRSVFEQIRFYEHFESNGYREETDFFVQAARAGFRCLLTPSTYCFQVDSWSGGQHHSSPWRYEYWTFRNNWRFLRRHGPWLVDQGYIHGVVSSQLLFAVGRLRQVGRGALLARLARLRHREGESAGTR